MAEDVVVPPMNCHEIRILIWRKLAARGFRDQLNENKTIKKLWTLGDYGNTLKDNIEMEEKMTMEESASCMVIG